MTEKGTHAGGRDFSRKYSAHFSKWATGVRTLKNFGKGPMFRDIFVENGTHV